MTRTYSNKGVPKSELGKFVKQFAESGEQGLVVNREDATLQRLKNTIKSQGLDHIHAVERDNQLFLVNKNWVKLFS